MVVQTATADLDLTSNGDGDLFRRANPPIIHIIIYIAFRYTTTSNSSDKTTRAQG
jgi:hypothetical protein